MSDRARRIRRVIARLNRTSALIAERDRLIAEEYWEARDAGQPVTHDDLAQRYNVSETTVRNAANAHRPQQTRQAVPA